MNPDTAPFIRALQDPSLTQEDRDILFQALCQTIAQRARLEPPRPPMPRHTQSDLDDAQALADGFRKRP